MTAQSSGLALYDVDVEARLADIVVLLKQDGVTLPSESMQVLLADFQATDALAASPPPDPIVATAQTNLATARTGADMGGAAAAFQQADLPSQASAMEVLQAEYQTGSIVLPGADPAIAATHADLLGMQVDIGLTSLLASLAPVAQFIQADYELELGRTASPDDVVLWTDAFTNSPLTQQSLRSIIGYSPEAQAAIQADYVGSLGRAADPSELSLWSNALTNGTESQLSIASLIAQSPEAVLHGLIPT